MTPASQLSMASVTPVKKSDSYQASTFRGLRSSVARPEPEEPECRLFHWPIENVSPVNLWPLGLS